MYEADGEEFADPYAQIIHGRDRWGKRRNPDSVRAGISLEEFDWKQDVLPRRDFSEVIMYQLHVRGLTKHSSSKVKDKGTYLGIIEKIPYLKELGINALMLLPTTGDMALKIHIICPLNHLMPQMSDIQMLSLKSL